jgi:diguanylate cyclase (GGDEF)-like protein
MFGQTAVLATCLVLASGAAALLAWLWWAERRGNAAARAALDSVADERRLLIESMEATPCTFAVFDSKRRLIAANGSYRELHAEAFATLPPPLRYDDMMRIAARGTHPPHEVEAEVARRVAAHSSEGRDFDRLYPNGRWMRIAKRRLPGGEVAGFAVDISGIKAREAALELSEARMRALLETAAAGMWQLDRAGRTISANGRLAALLGLAAPPETIAQAGFDHRSGDGPFGFVAGQETAATIVRPDGRRVPVLVAASPWLRAPDGVEMTVLSLLDMSALQAAQAQIVHLAEHDTLTGLPNRARFRRELDALVQGEGGTLLLIDLDHFKTANDRHGHAAGDAVLRCVAERLLAATRGGDVVCRLGGDEFAVILHGLPAEPAAAVAERIAAALNEPVPHDGRLLPCGATIGTAETPRDATSPDALFRAADLALYEGKRGGRGAAIGFRPALLEAVEHDERLREALAEALARGEPHLVFQPQRELGSGVLAGAEVLLRWDSTALGRAVMPAEFLPAARDGGLCGALDFHVLNAALDALARWRGRPDAPPVLAVNVTAETLREPDFPDRVAAALLRRRLPPESLEIEVPEDLAVRDLDSVAGNLERIAALGVRLALDDFGAGLSSLTHVVRLPVRRLKLDRTIVAGLDSPDGRSRAVLRATLALARGVGIEVVAEGVETEAQAFALRREGCATAQGWLVGRPVREAVLLGTEDARRAAV